MHLSARRIGPSSNSGTGLAQPLAVVHLAVGRAPKHAVLAPQADLRRSRCVASIPGIAPSGCAWLLLPTAVRPPLVKVRLRAPPLYAPTGAGRAAPRCRRWAPPFVCRSRVLGCATLRWWCSPSQPPGVTPTIGWHRWWGSPREVGRLHSDGRGLSTSEPSADGPARGDRAHLAAVAAEVCCHGTTRALRLRTRRAARTPG